MYRPYVAISILCSIGFIPRQLFVAESKGKKILSLCEFGQKKKKNRGLLVGLVRRQNLYRWINDSSEIYKMDIF